MKKIIHILLMITISFSAYCQKTITITLPTGTAPTTQTIFTTITAIRHMGSPLTSVLYYTTDFGKAGFWYYDQADDSSLDNLGTVLTSAATFRFKRVYDTKINVDWFGDFGTAVSNLGAIPSAIAVSTPQVLTTNITVPSNISLEIQKGGSIDNGGNTLAINGHFMAGRYQVFFGSGLITFGNGSCDSQFPEWDGAKFDGTDSAGGTHAFGLQKVRFNTPIELGVGTYLVDSISSYGTHPLIIYGQGRQVSAIQVSATSRVGISVAAGTSVEETSFKDFALYGTPLNNGGMLLGDSTHYTAYTGLVGIRIYNFTKTGAYGLNGATVQELDIDGIEMRNNYINILRPNYGYMTTTTFHNQKSYISRSLYRGYDQEGTGTVTFNNVVFETNANEAIYVLDTTFGRVTVDNCYFENNNTVGGTGTVSINGGSSVFSKTHFIFRNNYITRSANFPAIPVLYLDNTGANTTIANNFGLNNVNTITTTANTYAYFENNSDGSTEFRTVYKNLLGSITANDLTVKGRRFSVTNFQYGGLLNGDTLNISSTFGTTKGKIIIGSNTVYDEPNDNLGISTNPLNKLDVKGSMTVGTYAGVNTVGTANSLAVSGNIGIGQTTPTTKLHITQSFAGIQTMAIFENSYPSSAVAGPNIVLKGTNLQGFIRSSENPTLHFGGEVQISSNFNNTTENNGILIDRFGNVGINNLTPTFQLDVIGTENTSGKDTYTTSITMGAGDSLMKTHKKYVDAQILAVSSQLPLFVPYTGSTGAIIHNHPLTMNNADSVASALTVVGGGSFIGVQGQSTNSKGVKGISITDYGVLGTSTSGPGVGGFSTSSVGVTGNSGSNAGVFGISTSNFGVFGQSSSNIAVRGLSLQSNGGAFIIGGTLTSTNANAVLVAQRNPVTASGINATGDIFQIVDAPTGGGTFSGNAVSVSIDGTLRHLFTPRVADGGTAVLWYIDSKNTLATSGAKLASFRNAGSEKSFFDYSGLLNTPAITLSSAPATNVETAPASLVRNASTGNVEKRIFGTDGPVLLSSTTINVKSTGTTTIYTVPAGYLLVVTRVVARVIEATAITVGASASVTASVSGTIFGSAATGVTAVPQLYNFDAPNAASVWVSAAETVRFIVGTAATGTSQSYTVDLIGYLIPTS